MSLNFGAASSSVTFGIGGAANAGNGATTFLTLWKPGFGGTTNSGLLSALNSGTERRSFLIDTSALFGDGDFTSGVAISGSAGDWLWLGLSKAAGSTHYRMHWKNITTGGAWTHGEAASAANHSDPGTSNEIRVGDFGLGSVNGDVAVSSIWTADLADLAIEAACTSALKDLIAAGPAWAVRFQNSAPSSIQDLIGNGNETSRTGTVTNSADPPGFDFSLGVAIGQASTSRHPGRGPGLSRFYQPPAATSSATASAASGAGDASAHTATTATATKAVTAAAATPQHTSTSQTAVKNATGSAATTARPTTQATGAAGTPSGPAAAAQRAATASTGQKAATGASSATTRPTTTDTTVKKATGTAAATQHSTTTDNGAKKALGTGTPQAHPHSQATTATIPGGPALPGAHPNTVSSGKHSVIGTALSHPHTSTSSIGKATRPGTIRTTARALATISGIRSTSGTAHAHTHTATLSSGQTVAAFTPIYAGLDSSTYGSSLDTASGAAAHDSGTSAAGLLD